MHGLEADVDASFELVLEAIVDIPDFHDIVPCLRRRSTATGAKIPGVEWSTVVLGEHHPFIVVSGEKYVQIESGHLRVLLRVVQHFVGVLPVERSGQHPSGGRPYLIETLGVRVAGGRWVVTAFDDLHREKNERVHGGIFVGCLKYEPRVLVGLLPNLWSQSSPIVPESVWEALANELSGDIAFDHLRHLTLYHSPNAVSEGFRLSAKWVAAKAEEVGLQDVETLSLNKPTRGWTIRSGEARILSPFELNLGDVRETPLRVAVNSHSTEVTAALVDVGEGMKDSDYEGQEVKDKVVFASGEPGTVHRMAVWERGAAGVISYGSRRRAYPDQMPWRRISEQAPETKSPSTFAWILTEREGERLREKLDRADEPIEVKVNIRCRIRRVDQRNRRRLDSRDRPEPTSSCLGRAPPGRKTFGQRQSFGLRQSSRDRP